MLYADFECPRCGLAWRRLSESDLRVGIRHFPVSTSHPRARSAAAAAEAAAAQGAFHAMVESLFAEQGRLEDPHLWERAGQIGLDVARFVDDMRSEQTLDAVDSSFRAAIRAGVVTSPTLLVGDRLHAGVPERTQLQAWAS